MFGASSNPLFRDGSDGSGSGSKRQSRYNASHVPVFSALISFATAMDERQRQITIALDRSFSAGETASLTVPPRRWQSNHMHGDTTYAISVPPPFDTIFPDPGCLLVQAAQQLQAPLYNRHNVLPLCTDLVPFHGQHLLQPRLRRVVHFGKLLQAVLQCIDFRLNVGSGDVR
jgi:hypothetical protein